MLHRSVVLAFIRLSSLKLVAKGDYLFHKGSKSRYSYLVLEGSFMLDDSRIYRVGSFIELRALKARRERKLTSALAQQASKALKFDW
jgi:hypothetical protein